ncbi:hypothetical protein Bca52824_072658 [Brassica carinata]|uniref:Aldehyde dehydrogenase domain-containing protein n=1 Tax=Brassica carinata TaxID=52824 RepID=A0A8X7Q8E9_BRACI|nr:hypothetical protein Bca52824_072658 [Brassica carinata]
MGSLMPQPFEGFCIDYNKSLINRNSEKLAAIETWDDGKTYEQAKTAEIPMLARFFRYYAGIPKS